MLADFSRLKEKLLILKKVDKDFSIFGASSHNYKNHPISISEIERFEKKYNFCLPEQFRSFLLEIGFGAGPYYGIWSLKEIDSELSIEIEDFRKEENVSVSPANDFPFKWTDIESLKDKFTADPASSFEESTYPINGNVTIVSQGCQGYSTLVTGGELAGTIWNLYYEGGYTGFWNPASPATCLQASNGNKQIDKYEFKQFPVLETEKYIPESISFLDWYENWLDNSLLAFEELKKHNHFRFFNKLKPI